MKFCTGQMERFSLRFTENKWVEPPLNVFPKVWLKRSPDESGNQSISLLLDRPRSGEQSPVKKEKKLRSLLKISNSNGGVVGSLSLERIQRAITTNLSVKRGTALHG